MPTQTTDKVLMHARIHQLVRALNPYGMIMDLPGARTAGT
jgi:hypothetical protein